MKSLIKIMVAFISASVIAINIIPLFGQTIDYPKVENFDIIIVLGNPASDSCKPLPLMKERVKKGVELLNNGIAKKILFTGGTAANNCSEADVMKEYAKTLGVYDTLIITENRALNTYQNAFYSAKIMEENNYINAAIVTSNFHIKRGSNIFSNYPIKFNMFACNNPQDITNYKLMKWRFRENMILTYHFFFGYSSTFGL